MTPTRGGMTAAHMPLNKEKRNIPKMGGVCQEAVTMIGTMPEKTKEGGKTPYENEDEEDRFNPKDANGNPPKGSQDQESDDQASQR